MVRVVDNQPFVMNGTATVSAKFKAS
jgi:hypothetical protein